MPTAARAPLAKVNKQSTRDKVYDALREAILSGRLAPGERFKEIPLATELGVSRAILREAMRQLVHEGLLDFSPYRGAHVVELTSAQVDEILEARILLEGRAVRLAAENIDAAGKAGLREAERVLSAEIDPLRATQLDLALHRLIWRIAGQSAIEKLLVHATAPLFAMGLLMRSAERRGSRPGHKPPPRGSHRSLVEAICAQSPEAAERELQAHLSENWPAIRRRVDEFITKTPRRQRA